MVRFLEKKSKEPMDISILEQLREQWSGNLIVKGVLSVQDTKHVAAINADFLALPHFVND
jgi:isopentenyl diphosphate isomerase/L-lactate dehydrogenase-like FMN-dependent dehydrogenase